MLIKSTAHFEQFVKCFFKIYLTFICKKRAKLISELGSFLNLMTLPAGHPFLICFYSICLLFRYTLYASDDLGSLHLGGVPCSCVYLLGCVEGGNNAHHCLGNNRRRYTMLGGSYRLAEN